MTDTPPLLEARPVNGTGNGLTQRELLLEVRSDVSDLRTELAEVKAGVNIIGAGDYPKRVDDLERWKDRADGRMDLLVKGVPFVSAALSVAVASIAILAAGIF